jgi:hypothetical protein
MHLPPAPSYPLSVHSVRGVNPEQTVGQGPYSISAKSEDAKTESSAIGGLSVGGTGQTSGLTSHAAINVATTGEVISEATADVQGLAVGPLTIGQVISTARMTLGAGGAITRVRDLHIDGARIGGLPISISTDGLDVAGVPVPAPIGSTLAPLLKQAGITFELLPAQDFPDRVIAPAVRITVPVSGSALGTGDGTLTMTFGAATAYLTSAAALAPAGSDAPQPSASLPPLATSSGVAGPVSALPPSVGAPTAARAAGSTHAAAPIGEPTSAIGLWSIRTLYLLVAACALGAWVSGQAFRLLGVRRAWTSSAG